MEPFWYAALLMRWTHVFAATVALGGGFFLWAVLSPAAQAALGSEEHARLRAAVLHRWRITIHTAIGLLLLSGLFNYLCVMRPAHPSEPAYHALMGVKIAFALATFTMAILVTSRRGVGERLRRAGRFWTGIVVLLATATVLLSGLLHVLY